MSDLVGLVTVINSMMQGLITLPQYLSCNVQTENADIMFCPIGILKLGFPK
jgi:hypothetical protein